MDPITLVVAALTAGAAAVGGGAAKGLGEAASEAIKDSYAFLKSQVGKLFGDDEKEALSDLESDPDARKGELTSKLKAHETQLDSETIATAERLLELMDPAGASQGKYRVTVTGGQVGAVGDHANVTMGAPAPAPPKG